MTALRSGPQPAPARALPRDDVGERRDAGDPDQQDRPRRRGRRASPPTSAASRSACPSTPSAPSTVAGSTRLTPYLVTRADAGRARVVRGGQVHADQPPGRRRAAGDAGSARLRSSRPAHDDASRADRAARRRVADRHARACASCSSGARTRAWPRRSTTSRRSRPSATSPTASTTASRRCAVKQAVADGRLPADRLDSFHKLRARAGRARPRVRTSWPSRPRKKRDRIGSRAVRAITKTEGPHVSQRPGSPAARPTRVKLLVTCLVDTVFPQVGFSTVDAARTAGRRTWTCRRTRPAAASRPSTPARGTTRARWRGTSIDVFGDDDVPVVVPSGSCGDMVIHQAPHLLEDDPAYGPRAAALAARTYELTQFVVDVLGVTDVGARSERPRSRITRPVTACAAWASRASRWRCSTQSRARRAVRCPTPRRAAASAASSP